MNQEGPSDSSRNPNDESDDQSNADVTNHHQKGNEQQSEPEKPIEPRPPRSHYLQAVDLIAASIKSVGVIGFSTAVIAAAAIGQYCVSERQWKTANESLNVAQRSAKAAEDAVELARESFTQDQRPWILVSRVDRSPRSIQVGKEQKIVWNFWFLNYGKSPAINIRFDVNMAVGYDAINKVGREPAERVGAPLAPGQEHFSTAFDYVPTIPSFADLLKRDATIVVFGHFEYSDLFGGGVYETEFCFYNLASGATMPCPGIQNGLK